MAVEKIALDFSNPMVSSRINLERALDRFQETFRAIGAATARKRLRNSSASIRVDICPLGQSCPCTDAAACPTAVIDDKQK
jgi:hypothetical protein